MTIVACGTLNVMLVVATMPVGINQSCTEPQ